MNLLLCLTLTILIPFFFCMSRSLSFLVAGAIALASPFSVFAGGSPAATPSSLPSQDILNAVNASGSTSVIPPSPLPAPTPSDGKGGGSMNSSLYYPGPQASGVQVSAEVTTSVTPDFIGINAYCDSGKQNSRQSVHDVLQQIYTDIKNAVGKDGRVRKSGAISTYPYYDQGTGTQTDGFSGNLTVFVRITTAARAQDISDYIEQKNCTVNWDVRLVNSQQHELSILTDLSSQLSARKAVFEKLLQKRLNIISSASLSTWVDSYGTYDPDTNTVDATTTLNVTYDLGGRATIQAPTPVPLTK